MRKLIGAITALTLLTTLGVVVTFAGLSAADDNPSSQKQTFTLTSKTGPHSELDLGEPGFGLGDQFSFSNSLYRGDKKVGRDGGWCTIVDFTEQTEPVTAICVFTVELPKGQITMQGLLTFSETGPDSVVAITGGTGAYKTAHGQVTIIGNDVDDTQQLRFRVIR